MKCNQCLSFISIRKPGNIQGCIFKELTDIDAKVKGLPNIPEAYLPEYRLITTKAISPSQEELEMNNRSRSSKLRVIERIREK